MFIYLVNKYYIQNILFKKKLNNILIIKNKKIKNQIV